jgi:biotin carboxyl carrier protein
LATLPQELQIKPLFDQSVFVSSALDGVLREGTIAASLTAVMILLFLGSWRSTLVVATSIPLSICFSVLALHLSGQTINIMTLGGLALAVGILVDDATVEIENIQRNLAMGKSMIDAILDGALDAGQFRLHLAIYPRVQNSKELAAAAVAAGKTMVTVVEPTQTSSAPELVLPGNVTANQVTSIYSRVDGYLKKWYVDIGDHVQQGQVLADVEAPQIDADLRMAQAQLELAQAVGFGINRYREPFLRPYRACRRGGETYPG